MWGGQGELDQDAVDRRVVVEGLDAGQQFGLGEVGRVLLEHRVQAAVLAGLDLVAHVDLAGRVLADQHHRQAGDHAAGLERGGAGGDLGAQCLGERVAVDQLGCHRFSNFRNGNAR
jgi:hypothetical protein